MHLYRVLTLIVHWHFSVSNAAGPPRPGMLPTPPMGGPPMMPMMGPPPHGMMPGGPGKKHFSLIFFFSFFKPQQLLLF